MVDKHWSVVCHDCEFEFRNLTLDRARGAVTDHFRGSRARVIADAHRIGVRYPHPDDVRELCHYPVLRGEAFLP